MRKASQSTARGDDETARRESQPVHSSCRRRLFGSRWESLREQLAIASATRSARRQIRRDLGLSGVQDLQGLVDAVAASQNKPITIREVPLPLEVSALCARGTDRDFIVVDSQAAELTRLHAVLHELFHLWEEHPSDVEDSDLPMTEETVQQLLPGLNPGPVLQVLTRSHYDKAHERRAEAFATVLLQGHLALRTDQNSTGFLTSALAHRRSGV
ncbi:hypothetical protein [Streptomyces sp. NBC_00439]|uniref:hypothetical protein n=1 Tax=Streptomyces sp. NBC_00439 TaxID=2903650 RepID=UPI0022550A09|nr:hypothetical protein [Streptomyces sp. NBC_00439]MCX5103463.1 hypothetical protein [Streptomyces sp. NBC_00439]